jgi:hypothetical protein
VYAHKTFNLHIEIRTHTPDSADGQISLAGVVMTIQSVNTQNNTVVVQQLVSIPFELVDDDAATYPFNVDTFLMQDQDSSALNLFAPAYIRPTYDLGAGSKQAGFNLNVEDVATNNDLSNQLNAGRDFTSSDGYWVVYLQGAFQGSVTQDLDPNFGQTVQGFTLGLKVDGSLIFLETLRDTEMVLNITPGQYHQKTVVHEVGHQFGLDHPEGGIMQTGPSTPLRFEPVSLDKLRRVNHPLR